jgi:putative transposase
MTAYKEVSMPRRARLAVAGIPWHIIQRGNNRTACFYSAQDYRLYLQVLSEQATKYGCKIHAYVLMTNHVHLLLTPEKATGPSLMMKNLGQRYVQYINKTYRRTGTLWEGRFKSCLAQEEDYVLVCYRYIEMNPVRAGMVESPGEYPWSSYGCNGLGKSNSILSPHAVYLNMGSDSETRQNRYRGLFESHLPRNTEDRVRNATNGNYVLGNEHFRREIERMLDRRVTPGKPGRPRIHSKTN